MLTLKEILENKREEIEREKSLESLEQLKEKIRILPPTRDFIGSISKEGINILAETKIRSPTSKKRFNGKDMIDLARAYESSPVAAISVLTDYKYFEGNKEIMQQIKGMTTKPVLRKDFIIDPYQIYQSRAYGADAILLISHILQKEEILDFVDLSRDLGMECLVEFNNEKDLEKIQRNTNIYGRNYRKINSETDFDKEENLHEDIYTSPTYIEKIPANAIKVAESCIKSPADIKYLKEKGFNAFLIGTTIAQAKDIKGKIEELISA